MDISSSYLGGTTGSTTYIDGQNEAPTGSYRPTSVPSYFETITQDSSKSGLDIANYNYIYLYHSGQNTVLKITLYNE